MDSDSTFIPGTLSLTPYQARNALKKLGIPDTIKGLKYQRFFRPQIIIQNVGQTPCSVDSLVIVDFKMHETPIYKGISTAKIIAPAQNFSLEPTQKFIFNYAQFGFELLGPIPDFDFNLNVYFKNIDSILTIKKVFVQFKEARFSVMNQ